jgi:hypothetical protein
MTTENLANRITNRAVLFVCACAIAVALTTGNAHSGSGEEVWPFDLTTTGGDVFWTSPTAVANDAPRYEGSYEITLIEVTGMWGPFPIGPIDVTGEVPEEDRTGTDIVDGPPPIVLLDDSLVYPEPPEDPSIAADVLIYLDVDGFGQIEITNVYLGTVELDTDFGTVNVQITSVRVAGVVTVKPLGPLGDLNNDGAVDGADLLILLSAWGKCADPDDCPADLNDDGTVDGADLLILLSHWG